MKRQIAADSGKSLLRIVLPCFLVFITGCCKQSPLGPALALKTFDEYVEQVRWKRYWHQPSDKYKNYVEGRTVAVLLFWTKTALRPKRGFCSTDLATCVANHSGDDSVGIAQLEIDPNISLKSSFSVFASRNYGDGDVSFPSLSEKDFEFEEKKIALPFLGLPAPIANLTSPESLPRDAEDVRRQCGCWQGAKRPADCKGTLILPFYSKADETWYVFRRCSSACEPEFRGDAVFGLSRRFGGWSATIGGFTNNPADVEWFRPKIESATALREEIP